MSAQQSAVERLFNEVVNARNLDAADEVLAHDFVDHGPMGAMPGLEAFKQLVTMWLAAVPDAHCTVENWFESGAMAGWTVRVTGTHTGEMIGIAPTGRTFEYVTPNVARFEGGKVVEHWSDQGMFQFMTQIGALDQQTPAQG